MSARKSSQTNKHVRKMSAFVMMPFADPINGYFSAVFRPALRECGFEVWRADDPCLPQSIIEDIREQILSADVLLCEMTGKNPNVFYELGLAHAIGKPVILVAQAVGDIPFDLSHIRTILYDPRHAGWEAKLKSDIMKAAEEVIKNNFRPGPPPLVELGKVSLQAHLAGVHKVSTGQSRAEAFLGLLARASSSLSVLGIGMTNITKYARKDLMEVSRRVPVRFLMLDPVLMSGKGGFPNMLNGFLDIGDFASQITASFKILHELCEKANKGNKTGKRMSLRLYSTVPTMSMVMIDEKTKGAESEVEFFVYRAGGSRPRLSVKKMTDGEGAFELFHDTFNAMWRNGRRII